MNTFSESDGGGLKLSSEPKGPGAKFTLGPDSGLGFDQTKLQVDSNKIIIVNIFLASKRSVDDSWNLKIYFPWNWSLVFALGRLHGVMISKIYTL